MVTSFINTESTDNSNDISSYPLVPINARAELLEVANTVNSNPNGLHQALKGFNSSLDGHINDLVGSRVADLDLFAANFEAGKVYSLQLSGFTFSPVLRINGGNDAIGTSFISFEPDETALAVISVSAATDLNTPSLDGPYELTVSWTGRDTLNDAPIVNDKTLSSSNNDLIQIDLLTGVTDTNNDPLTVSGFGYENIVLRPPSNISVDINTPPSEETEIINNQQPSGAN